MRLHRFPSVLRPSIVSRANTTFGFIRAFRKFLGLAAVLLALPALSQTTYTWTNLVSGDASGFWDTAINWSPNGLPVSGDTADFSTLDITLNSTLSLNGNRTNAALVFGDVTASSDWTVDASGILTLETAAGSPVINVTNRTATIQAAIDGTNGFTKLGAGTLVLSAQSFYSGVTTQSQGTLTIATAGTGTPDTPVSGPFGVSTLSLEGGTLNTAVGGGIIYNPIVVPAGKTIAMGTTVSGVQLSLAGSISGGGTINESGSQVAGTHLSGTNSSFTGTFNSTGGGSHRVRFDNFNSGSANAVWNASVTTTDGWGFTGMGNGNTIHFGSLTGNGQMRSDNGNNTTFYMSIGALNANSTFSGTIVVNGTQFIGVNKVGSGTLIFSGNNTYNGPTTISNGVLQLGAGGTTGNIGSATVSNYSKLVFSYNRSDTFAFPGNNISGTGSLSFTNLGTGIMTLTGINTESGDTTIAAGAIRLLSSFAIPGGPGLGNLILNGTLDLNTNNIAINGLSGGGIVDNITNTAPASLTIGSNDAASTFNGIIRNTGATLSVTKVGTGKITLGGANTYRGSTTINGGELDLTTSQTGGGAITVSSGSTLGVLVNSASPLPTATLTAASGSALNFSGISSTTIPAINATNLAPTGSVTINVAGAFGGGNQYPLIKFNSYSAAGGFVLGTVPSGVVANLVTNGTTIALNVTSALPLIWKGNVSSNWDIATTANWTLNNVASTYNDGQTVEFDDSAATSLVNLSANVAPGGVLVSNNSLSYTMGSATAKGITGNGGVTKLGSASLTLSGLSNSYSGFTTIGGGTVVINADQNLGAAGTVVINGGTLSAAASLTLVANRTLVLGPASGSGTGTIDVAAGEALTFAGAVANNLSGTGSLVKSGTGTLALNGANSYSGSTLVSAGTLSITAAQQSGAPITVNNGATLNVSRTGGSTLPTSTLTLGSGGATALGFGNPGSSLANPVITATNLTTSGSVTVRLLTGVPALGEIPLIKYSGAIGGSGFGAFTLAALPPGVTAVLTNDTANKIVGLHVSDVAAVTWTGTNGTSWDVGVTTNWQFLGAPVTFSAGNAVIFDDTAFTNQVTLNSAAEVFNMLVTNNALNYTLNGVGSLIGPMSLTKTGSNTFTIANLGNNSFTGGTVIQEGTLDVRVNNGLGTGAIVLAGGTLENNSPATLALANPVHAQTGTTSTLQLTGLAGQELALNGNITGDGTIIAQLNGGLNSILLGGDNSGFTGTLRVNNNSNMRFWFTVPSAGSANANWVLDSAGVDNQKFTFGTGTVAFGSLAGNGQLRNDGGASTVTLRVGDLNTNTTFSGLIVANGTAQFAILKVGTGTWTITANETYTGSTTISNGVLALANNPVTFADGTLSGTPNIYIAAGAALDVSGRSDLAMPLGANQLLRGNGSVLGDLNVVGTIAPGDGLNGNLGTLTVTNTVNLFNVAWMKLNRAASPNSDCIVATNINYGGTLIVTNVGAALQPGDTFTLFRSANPPAGAFTLVLPNYYTWDTSNLGVNGTITVVGTFRPVIDSVDFSTLSGGFITISATNGAPNGPVNVLMSTNLALPLSSWQPVTTNVFDGLGNYVEAIPVDPAAPQEFYILRAR